MDHPYASLAGKDVLGVALAGGKSIRMGVDKAKLKTSTGLTFLEIAYARLARICALTLVSCAKGRKFADYVCLEDAWEECGPAGALTTALAFARSRNFKAILVSPCDMPMLPDEFLLDALQVFTAHPAQPLACLYRSRLNGRMEMLVGAYSIAALPFFEKAMIAGQHALRRILPPSIISLPYGGTDAAFFLNCNRPADLCSRIP